MKNKKISIVLPTYNERENIKKLLPTIIKICRSYFEDYEILVIDDNSPDKTYEEAKKFSKYNVRVFVRKRERGLASAIKFGIEKAKYRYICVMDADFQHPPKYIPKLFKELIEKKVDIVIASRFLKDSEIEGFKFRKNLSKIAIFLISSFFPNIKNVKDPLSGFFILDKEKINLDNMKCIGFKFLFELLAKQKLNVIEIPFTFEKRKFGKSKLNFKEFINFIILFFGLLKETNEYIRILKFVAIGISGIFINQFLLFFLTEYLSLYYLISGIIAIESSILWNFILNEIFTFSDLRKKGLKEFLKRMVKTNIIRIFGLVINISILFILTEFFSIHYLISNLIGIFIAFLFNYILSLKKIYG